MTRLAGALVLLTGAAGGFGAELSQQLMSKGCRLILSDCNKAGLTDLAAKLRQQGHAGELLACIEADLCSSAGCNQLIDQTASICQKLAASVDVLINNAGLAVYGRHDEVPPEQWERLMQVNLLAPMRLSAPIAADMVARQQGHIVFVSSLAGWTALAGLADYAASKFALRGSPATSRAGFVKASASRRSCCSSHWSPSLTSSRRGRFCCNRLALDATTSSVPSRRLPRKHMPPATMSSVRKAGINQM